MRDYAKVSPRRWTGETGRALRGHIEAQVVVDYLLTCQHANMLGVYYLPIQYLAVDTGLPLEGAWKGLRRAIEVGFAAYDEETEVVWVRNMARDQVADDLKANDLRCKGIQREYDSLPNNPFLSEFFDTYASFFHMTKRREWKPLASPLGAPSKALQSQEQDQEQDQEQEERMLEPAPAGLLFDLGPETADEAAPIQAVWDAHLEARKRSGKTGAGPKLDDNRRALIRRTLKKHPAEYVACAARAVWLIEYNVRNGYTGIELALRHDKIDRFAAVGERNVWVPESGASGRQATPTPRVQGGSAGIADYERLKAERERAALTPDTEFDAAVGQDIPF